VDHDLAATARRLIAGPDPRSHAVRHGPITMTTHASPTITVCAS
jgi:hypothetical protein